jgi:regulation of enolase protein 1 (concanavalin A-like superfamily)
MKIAWTDGTWQNAPPRAEASEAELIVTTADQSDFWNRTGYGFVHNNGHALLRDFPAHTAMEVEFSAEWTHEFDQAGLFVYADPEHWVKAGVEFADGVLGLGAVVTDGRSDWSLGQVPEWMDQTIRVRVSRSTDAISVRARTQDEPWRLVRLAPIDATLTWFAGPLAASPTRANLKVTFHEWQTNEPDDAIHP